MIHNNLRLSESADVLEEEISGAHSENTDHILCATLTQQSFKVKT